jgi:flavin reductase (DIM6/NTAB) family NADH-FMN oxidoreductase RutF/rubredoxin
MNIESFYKITYGLYVVSSFVEKKFNGYISNTVFQVTAEPSRLAIACSKNNFTNDLIRQSQVFGISALQKECRPEIIGTFGYKSGLHIEKFEGFNYLTGSAGTPILLDDTLAWFECRVVQSMDMGTHILFIGDMIDCELLNAAAEPLTYAYYREVKKGKAPKNAPTYIANEKLIRHSEETLAAYYCTACGYVYDPLLGDPKQGIAAGTPFENLPDAWVCPVCGSEKSDFAKK